jgi:hypothetical protein
LVIALSSFCSCNLPFLVWCPDSTRTTSCHRVRAATAASIDGNPSLLSPHFFQQA